MVKVLSQFKIIDGEPFERGLTYHSVKIRFRKESLNHTQFKCGSNKAAENL
jgi:hypothetical protein